MPLDQSDPNQSYDGNSNMERGHYFVALFMTSAALTIAASAAALSFGGVIAW